MALERVPADIRREGGVARMSDPTMIKEIKQAVTIPVMAKVRQWLNYLLVMCPIRSFCLLSCVSFRVQRTSEASIRSTTLTLNPSP